MILFAARQSVNIPLWPDADVFLQFARAGFAAIEVAGSVGRDEFRSVPPGEAWIAGWQHDEIVDPACLGVANTDSHFVPRVLDVVGFRIGNEDVSIGIKGNAAGSTELRPLGDVGAVLLENLQAIVKAIGDEKLSLVVDG